MTSKKFVYYFQKIFFALSTLLFAFGSAILNEIFPKQNGRYSRILLRIWGRSGLWLNFSRVKLIDKPKFVNETCVILCNHQSEIDIYVAAGYFPIDFVFFSKQEVFDNPFMGYGMHAARHIPVNRSEPRKAAQALLTSKKVLNDNISVLFYPEATYAEDANKFLPFKAGALSIAAKTNKPIFPVIIYGAQAVFDDHHPQERNPGVVHIKFLEIIHLEHRLHPTHAKTKSDLELLAEEYRQMMQQAYDAVRQRMGRV